MPVLNKGVWTQDETLVHTDIIPTQTTPEADRYHLYFSLACPYAHRVNLVIHYLELDHVISSSTLEPKMVEGWVFSEQYPDPLYHSEKLSDLYLKHKPDFSGRVVVPVFWDKKEKCIASNTSADLSLELSTKWLSLAKFPYELTPDKLKESIIQLNQWLITDINSQVYTVARSRTQDKYEKELCKLFASLNLLNERLATQRYLFGEQITLSDFFLFPTLIRFEAIYESLFKCNQKPLSEFHHLYRYMLDLYTIEKIKSTVDIEFSKIHYFYSMAELNPTRIIPVGPKLVW